MKKTMIVLSLAVSSLLLTGCGAGSQTQTYSTQQPHIKDTRTAVLKDWTYNVGANVNTSNGKTEIKTYYYDNIPNTIKHFQVFIDSKPNQGYNGSDGWEVYGADYLIEDNKLFKSLSDTEWKWQYIKDVSKSDNQQTGGERAITLTTDNLPITTEDVNIYVETYDENWVGEYYTIPLVDISVKEVSTTKPSTGDGYPKVTRAELDEMIKNGEDYSKVDVSGITDMSKLFEDKEVTYDISGWDVSNVTNMNKMFAGHATSYEMHANTFNQDISNWDVSNVTNMSGMFLYTKYFNQPIGKWNVSNVTDMSDMFAGTTTVSRYPTVYTHHSNIFNQDISNWNVSNVTNMHGMFLYAKYFNQPIGKWNVGNVTNMSSMFHDATSFNQPVGNWNVSSVINMSNMFTRTYSFNQSIDNWDVSNVTNMHGMFIENKVFNKPLENWDVSSVKDMSLMFVYAYTFNQPIGNWDVSNVSNMSSMFNYAKSFNKAIENWDVSNVNNYYLFSDGSPLQDSHKPPKFR